MTTSETHPGAMMGQSWCPPWVRGRLGVLSYPHSPHAPVPVALTLQHTRAHVCVCVCVFVCVCVCV